MLPLGSKQLEHMARCLEFAERASGRQRDLMIALAHRLHRNATQIELEAVQIEQSRVHLAASRAAIELADALLSHKARIS